MVDPVRGMETVRALESAVRDLGVVAATFFPCGCVPQVPIDDRMAYPVYAKCVELDIPIFINAGVPGPRVPMDAQEVALLDKVCWFFPDLRIVLRHGARAVGGSRRQADGEVAEPLLLHQRVRAQVLPARDHRLREQLAAAPARSSTPATTRRGFPSSASSASSRISR